MVDPLTPMKREKGQSFEVRGRGHDGLRAAAKKRLVSIKGIHLRSLSFTRDGLVAYVERRG